MNEKTFTNLYNKYKPKKYDDVLGQNLVKKLLQRINSTNLPNSIIFCGIHGIGKTLLAQIFTKAINCLNSNEKIKPCNDCSNCLAIENNIEDILEIDAATYTGVDNIRQLKEQAIYAPIQLKYKVFIIDEVHMLSYSAFNALLKILENPPVFLKFIFATTDLEKLPDTFKSRCCILPLSRIPKNDLVNYLKIIVEKEGKFLSDRILNFIAEEGSIRSSLSRLQQILLLADDLNSKLLTEEEICLYLHILSPEKMINIFTLILDGNATEALNMWQNLNLYGYSEKAYFNAMQQIICNLFKVKEGYISDILYQNLLDNYDITIDLLVQFWEILIKNYESIYLNIDNLVEVTILMMSSLESEAKLSKTLKICFPNLKKVN